MLNNYTNYLCIALQMSQKHKAKGSSTSPQVHDTVSALVASQIVLAVSATIAAYYCFNTSPLDFLSIHDLLRIKSCLQGFAASLPAVALSLCILYCQSWCKIFRDINRTTKSTALELFGHERDVIKCIVFAGIVSLFTSLGEELSFRGLPHLLFSGYTSDSKMVGILLSSALFGIIHGNSIAYKIFATLYGLYFAFLREFVGNNAIPIIAHAAYDFVIFIVVHLIATKARAAKKAH